MDNQFGYNIEYEKLKKNKLEWDKIKSNQESRLKLESNILMNLEESLLRQSFNNNEGNISKNISELESLKNIYQKKLRDINSQINLIEIEQQQIDKNKNESINLLNKELEDCIEIQKEQNIKIQEISQKYKILEEEEQKILKKNIVYEKNISNL